jgi:hypothetical protein
MALKPGTMSDFQASMAAAMEAAFRAEWTDLKGGSPPAAGEQDRQLLFAAIAQGVVRHLREQANSAFQINVSVRQTDEVLLQSDNPAAIPVAAAGDAVEGEVAPHQAVVKQQNNADNRISCAGQATSVRILTEED